MNYLEKNTNYSSGFFSDLKRAFKPATRPPFDHIFKKSPYINNRK